MEIQGPSQIQGVQSIKAPNRIQPTQQTENIDSSSPVDRVDISPEAQLIDQVHDLPEMRTDRIADIRAQIDSGVYETEEKLDIAMGRLLDEIT